MFAYSQLGRTRSANTTSVLSVSNSAPGESCAKFQAVLSTCCSGSWLKWDKPFPWNKCAIRVTTHSSAVSTYGTSVHITQITAVTCQWWGWLFLLTTEKGCSDTFRLAVLFWRFPGRRIMACLQNGWCFLYTFETYWIGKSRCILTHHPPIHHF